MNLDLSGEGIAAVILALGTLPAGIYTMWRQIEADRKMDRSQRMLDQVALNQVQTHKVLDGVVDVVKGVQVNVAKVEKATNSLKDALVETTKTAYLLKGRNQGIAAEKARTGTDDPAQPDDAPTPEQLTDAIVAQEHAVSDDMKARASEATTVNKDVTTEQPPRTNP